MTEQLNMAAPSGFPELLPEERILELRVLDLIRQEYESYGFLPIETPAVERNEILQAKGGFDSKEIYQLSRLTASAGEKKDRDFSLHFDLTVPFARYSATHFGKLVFPFKRYQIQKSWRGERPGSGRFREFYQADIDIIGVEVLPTSYDAEVLAVVSGIFEKLNIGKFLIRVNNRKLHSGLIEHLELPSHERKSKFQSTIQDISETDRFDVVKFSKGLITERFSLDHEGKEAQKIYNWILDTTMSDEDVLAQFVKYEQERIVKILDCIDKVDTPEDLIPDLVNKLDITLDKAKVLVEFATLAVETDDQESLLAAMTEFCGHPLYQQGVRELSDLLDDAEAMGVPRDNISLDPKIARGLDYYTGVIYETDLAADPTLGSVCSGGRYDKLADKFTKKNLPGVGISIGASRLVSSIIKNKLIPLPDQSTAKVMIGVSDENRSKLLELASLIRKHGVPCEVLYLPQDKQMKYAARKGAWYVIRSSDVEGSFKVRDMRQKDRKLSENVIHANDIVELIT